MGKILAPGYAKVVVGLDYGDEGKGRVVDELLSTGEFGIVARFNGGNNAGHTLVTKDGKKVVLNSIPSGILHGHVKTNYIGSGCVVDPVNLVVNELPAAEEHVNMDGRLKIAACSTVITPIHILLDKLGGGMIGTTNKGIGPAYADQATRAIGDIVHNLRFADILVNPKRAKDMMMAQFIEMKYEHGLGVNIEEAEMEKQIDKCIQAVSTLEKRGFIELDIEWIGKQVRSGVNVLLEGAQAFGLDVRLGASPFVTSSGTTALNATDGATIPAKYIKETIGVSKLTPSKVGGGCFVGEYGDEESERYCDEKDENGKPRYNEEVEGRLYDPAKLLMSDNLMDIGIALRMLGKEYGAVSKRPRRMGPLDMPRMGLAARVSGVDTMVLTKLDCLKDFRSIQKFGGRLPIITEYVRDGKVVNVPQTTEELRQIKPKVSLIEVPDEKNYQELVAMIEAETLAKVTALGIGPARDQMLHLLAA